MADGLSTRLRSTPLRWIEMAALLPCTVVLAPLLFYAGIGSALGMIAVWFSHGGGGLGTLLFLLTQMWIGVASVCALWILLLIGQDRVREKPVRRWSILILMVLGLADAAHFLSPGAGDVGVVIKSDARTLVAWIVLLGLPMAVGARHAYLLLRR